MFQPSSLLNDDVRRLIVNADDFGQSPGINAGVIEAHRQGIVTSASLMVRWPAAVEAAALSQEYPRLSVGLHVDVGEWRCDHGQWQPVYRVVSADDQCALRGEVAWQLQRFHELMGCAPTHLDSHQHRHRDEPLRSLLIDMARQLRVPLREYDPRIRYCGLFYGQSADGTALASQVTWSALLAILHELPRGITELCCHPARNIDFTSMYSHTRLEELRTLTDSRARHTLATLGIDLRSFQDIESVVA